MNSSLERLAASDAIIYCVRFQTLASTTLHRAGYHRFTQLAQELSALRCTSATLFCLDTTARRKVYLMGIVEFNSCS